MDREAFYRVRREGGKLSKRLEESYVKCVRRQKWTREKKHSQHGWGSALGSTNVVTYCEKNEYAWQRYKAKKYMRVMECHIRNLSA